MGICLQEEQRKPKDNKTDILHPNKIKSSIDQISDKDPDKPKEEPKRIFDPLLVNKKENNKELYDAIFRCESLNKLFHDEWTYFLSYRFVERIQREEEEKKFCSVCMMGETNKGKTFLVNLLTDNELQSGGEYKTVGISCKFTDFSYEQETDEGNKNLDEKSKEKKFLIFDSAGRSEPLLIEPEERKKLTDEELKNRVEIDHKDLRLSEDFLKNFLISHSKIIIVVVNQLTLAEQLFLYDLKSDNEDKYEELFIIHNLFNFDKRKDMEDYINNTIVHSIYFDISKDYFDTIGNDDNDVNKPYYFTEEQNNNNKGNHFLIAHLFLGNTDSKDKWIKNMTDMTINFLKTKMQICIARQYFSLVYQIEKELQSVHLIDGKTNLEISETNDNNEGFNGILRLKKKIRIIKKKFIISLE